MKRLFTISTLLKKTGCYYFLLSFLLLLFNPKTFASYIVNISENISPQSGLDHNKNPHGLIIDLSKLIFPKVEFISYPLARALNITEKEKNTLLFISRTKSREDKFAWIDTIYMSNVYIYTNNNKFNLKNKNDINILESIGVLNGSSLIQTLKDANYTKNIETVINNEQNLKKLISKRIDGWIEGEIVAEYLMKKMKINSNLFKRFGPVVQNVTWIATAKNSDLDYIKDITKRVKKFKESKSYEKILESYKAHNPD